MTRYVGVDLHRRRSVIVVLDADGTELWTKRIDNDPLTLGLEIEKAGPAPEVVLQATWGWFAAIWSKAENTSLSISTERSPLKIDYRVSGEVGIRSRESPTPAVPDSSVGVFGVGR